MKDYSDSERRMCELMAPVDQQLMMCDDYKDQLMMASAMLQRVIEVYEIHLGVDGRKYMFKELV